MLYFKSVTEKEKDDCFKQSKCLLEIWLEEYPLKMYFV